MDSLLTLIESDKEDTNKVNHLIKLCAEYYKNGEYEKGLHFGYKAIELSDKIPFQKGLAKAYNNIGNINHKKGEYDKSIENYFKALKIWEEIDDKKGMAGSYNNIGTIHKIRGDYDNAMNYHLKSLKIKEEIGDKKGMAKSYNNIGIICKNRGEYFQAIEYYLKDLKICEEFGDKQGIASSYNNIGIVYEAMGDNNKAIEYYLKDLRICEELEDRQGAAISYYNIGDLYLRQNNVPLAQKNGEYSLKIALELKDKLEILKAHLLLSSCDSATGNWRAAYENYKLYKLYNDSVFNEESNKQITEMSTRYESEKKEKEIELQKTQLEKKDAENKKQLYVIWSVVTGLGLVGVFSLIVFRRWRNEQRQKLLIEQQKEVIAHKNKDLTDSIHYAERIQRAILTSEQSLNEMFLPQGQTASHFVLYKPKDIVAGDFYWAYQTQNGKAIWVTADCTGHGVPGAFMSMIGNSLLNEIVIEKCIEEPAEILNNLRTEIIRALGQSGESGIKDGMDCALCCWDKANNKIIFSGANNPLWIIRNKEFIELKGDKHPVGNYTDDLKPFTQKVYDLLPGDILYTFTDGYADQFGGPRGKKFKYIQLKEILLSFCEKPMPEQRDILNETIEKWRGEMEQIDDICFFGVRV